MTLPMAAGQDPLTDSFNLTKVIERHVVSVWMTVGTIAETARLIDRDETTVRMLLARAGLVQSNDKRFKKIIQTRYVKGGA